MSKYEPASEETEPVADLDELLAREIGQFGRYQRRLLVTAVLVSAVAGWSVVEYVFTTGRINTRCLIPECEVAGSSEFSPPWLANAVPSDGSSFDGCRRYATRTFNDTDKFTDCSCSATLFDPTVTVLCEQYVFEDTYTAVYDLELPCDEWRRSLIGSVRTFGMLFGLPITGFVSDRWGRRTALIINAFNTAWIGITRYWANSYTAFVISEFAEAAAGSGTYSCIYIILLELVGPKYRVCAGTVTHCGSTMGYMTVALVAWAVPYWRHLTLALYVSQLLVVLYIFMLPESFRWYQSKGKFDKAEKAIKEVARVNGKHVSDSTLLKLKNNVEAQRNKIRNKNKDEPWLIVQVFEHKPIMLRCLTSPVWWIAITFVYFGMSINAVHMVGNRYLNYILVSAVEIPGFWMAVLLMDRLGRRPVLTGGFWLCALCQIGYIFISNDMFVVSLLIYLIGKSSISMVGATVYIYTAELYPTQYRHSLFAFSSMMGRIGSILAPLTPALGAAVFESLPFMLFGGMALLAGLLVLLTPETLGTRLPDTMLQAANLGREKSRRNEDASGLRN